MNKTDYYIPLYNECLYHIYNRGNGREKIFYEPANYAYFHKQYEKYISEFVDTYAFCLLPNHFHLLVKIKHKESGIISEAFRKLFISYSMSINKQQQRKGSLFQRGFKRKLINAEKYFYAAVYYIHSNPVHHRLVPDFKKYKYSSFSLLSGEKETKLCRSEVMDWFGGKDNFMKYHLEKDRKNYDYSFMIEDDE